MRTDSPRVLAHSAGWHVNHQMNCSSFASWHLQKVWRISLGCQEVWKIFPSEYCQSLLNGHFFRKPVSFLISHFLFWQGLCAIVEDIQRGKLLLNLLISLAETLKNRGSWGSSYFLRDDIFLWLTAIFFFSYKYILDRTEDKPEE